MIGTDRQVARARAELEQLRDALRSEEAESPQAVAAELAAAAVAGIQAQIDELEAEIAEYEELRTGRLVTMPVTSLLDISKVLIAARLSAGLTQTELAERIGVSQQQVQKDEAGDYTRASLERLHSVAALLGVQLEGTARLSARGALQPVPSRKALLGSRHYVGNYVSEGERVSG
jgi:HTH-type transcriptional regulator/antitoxin HigA